MSPEKLIEKAVTAQKLAKAKYSNFPVGAAILCEDGKVIYGSLPNNVVKFKEHGIIF